MSPGNVLQSAGRGVRRRLPSWTKPPLRWAAAAADPLRLRALRRRSGYTGAIPPRPLRADVGDPDPERFLANGARLTDEFAQVASDAGADLLTAGTVLDLACGCGRVLEPLRRRRGGHGMVVGSDVHPGAVKWLAKNLGSGGRAVLNDWRPPLPFDESEFDIVYSYSFFTHLDGRSQALWLPEVARVLRPGGLALLTTHGPEAYERFRAGSVSGAGRDLQARLRAYGPLAKEGFVFEPYAPGENETAGIAGPYGVAFNHERQIVAEWSHWLDVVDHKPGAAQGWQDVCVLQRRDQ